MLDFKGVGLRTEVYVLQEEEAFQCFSCPFRLQLLGWPGIPVGLLSDFFGHRKKVEEHGVALVHHLQGVLIQPKG